MGKTAGERLEELRAQLGVSMAEMGRRTGVGRDVIANYAYGRTEPKETFVRHAALVFGVSAEYLLTGEGDLAFAGLTLAQTQAFLTRYRGLPAPLRAMADEYLDGVESTARIVREIAQQVEADSRGWRSSKSGKSAFVGYLEALLEKRGLKLKRLTHLSALQKDEVYAALEGGHPDRRFVVKLGLALQLSLEETQMLLRLSDNGLLSIDADWDANVIMAMMGGAEPPIDAQAQGAGQRRRSMIILD